MKHIKQVLAGLLIFLLMLSLPAASAETGETLIGMASALAAQVDALCGDDAFLKEMIGYSNDQAKTWARQNHDAPRLAVAIEVTPPEPIPEKYADRRDDLLAGVLRNNMIYAMDGEASMTSVVTQSIALKACDLEGAGNILLLYDNAAPALIDWRAQNGALYMAASLVDVGEQLRDASSPEDVQAWLAENGLETRCTLMTDFPLPAGGSNDGLTLVQRAEAVARSVAAKAADGEWPRMMGLSDNLIEKNAKWAEGNYEQPKYILHCTMPAAEDDATPGEKEIAIRQTLGLPTQVIAQTSAENLAAVSASTHAGFAAANVPDGCGTYLFGYADGTPIMVSYRVQDGAVFLQGNFTPVSGLQESTIAKTAADWLTGWIPGVVCEEVTLATADPTPAPTATPRPAKQADSVVEGGIATPTPTPRPELPPLRDDAMVINLVEISQRIDLLAKNERFMGAFNFAALADEDIARLTRGDHTRPRVVYHVSGDQLIQGLYAGQDASSMLDFTRPELLRDLVGELPEMLWGRRESAELSMLSHLARFKVFAAPEKSGCGLYMLLYEDATPIVVSWYAQQGAVEMAAFFMPIAELEAVASADDMAAWFAAQGMPEVVFEEVPLT